jgi:hypothetical protein
MQKYYEKKGQSFHIVQIVELILEAAHRKTVQFIFVVAGYTGIIRKKVPDPCA